jgi:hypothetical protein
MGPYEKVESREKRAERNLILSALYPLLAALHKTCLWKDPLFVFVSLLANIRAFNVVRFAKKN